MKRCHQQLIIRKRNGFYEYKVKKRNMQENRRIMKIKSIVLERVVRWERANEEIGRQIKETFFRKQESLREEVRKYNQKTGGGRSRWKYYIIKDKHGRMLNGEEESRSK